ncbi:MAG: ABC transporter ATP-binding protein [Oscillospiraceae bacterium]|nr:ABC transporter ATP-binding protein [Oscillospiraceae bacterium]
MTQAIFTKAVTKDYYVGDHQIRAVRGIDFSAQKGEFLCISGKSGSGKSTLLNLLAGLEKPTGGEITLLDKRIDTMSETQRIRFRRSHVGFVFQSYNLLPQYSALENVALPLAVSGIPARERSDLAMKMLEMVGLSGHAAHMPGALSGGQQQRASIARAIITRPDIVFADEPTGNLDTATGDEVMRLLTRIFREWNTTFLVVTHDPDMRKYTDKEIFMRDGRIVSGV